MFEFVTFAPCWSYSVLWIYIYYYANNSQIYLSKTVSISYIIYSPGFLTDLLNLNKFKSEIFIILVFLLYLKFHPVGDTRNQKLLWYFPVPLDIPSSVHSNSNFYLPFSLYLCSHHLSQATSLSRPTAWCPIFILLMFSHLF